MPNHIKLHIDTSINCYAFEDIDLNQGSLKISYIEFSNKTVLLDKSYYMTKENFKSEGKECLQGEFNNDNLSFSYEPMEPAKEFKVSIDGNLEFKSEDDANDFNNLSDLQATFVSISFTSEEGIQDDLSTSSVDFCDIKKS
jgi:hypothetical protein|tara:strand:- start:759 stop:1181 length:423 start_codon:yes stop_codon:yes gene_type:complete